MSTNPERMTKAMPELSETTIVVTGANSGLGYEATRIFAEKSATVVMACRSTDRGEDAAEAIAREAPSASLDVLELDLADLDSVRDFAAAFTGAYDDLHMLCNNAGVMAIPRRETADGFETQFGVNHLSHFALTGRLLDTLVETEGETRVVTQSSKAHESGEIDFDSVARSATESANGSAVSNDPQRKRSYDRWAAYGQSKLANVLFAYELDRRLGAADHDVTSVACHPGYAATEFQGPRDGELDRQETADGGGESRRGPERGDGRVTNSVRSHRLDDQGRRVHRLRWLSGDARLPDEGPSRATAHTTVRSPDASGTSPRNSPAFRSASNRRAAGRCPSRPSVAPNSDSVRRVVPSLRARRADRQ
jgi:NAD(P)-dependent dehydrogenase (short-subunit alcohol dehydrogenase family)